MVRHRKRKANLQFNERSLSADFAYGGFPQLTAGLFPSLATLLPAKHWAIKYPESMYLYPASGIKYQEVQCSQLLGVFVRKRSTRRVKKWKFIS